MTAMTPDEFQQHREYLVRFMELTHRITAVIVLFTFLGYGLAAYIWLQGEALAGLVIATLSYLVFRMFRSISLGLAQWRLQDRAEFADTLSLLERELEARKPQEVFAEIEARVAEAGERSREGDDTRS